jgi:hypothetical protein
MKMVLHISAGFLLLLLASCGSSRKDLKEPESGTARYQAEAVQKYGQGVEFVFNDGKTAVLCLKMSKPSAKNPQQQVSFFVFDLSIDSTIFEDNLANGSVSWKDNITVLVSTVPGIVKSDETSAGRKSGYIFDLRSRKTKSLDAANVQ